MNKHAIDLNADVGEGIGNDAMIIPYLSSCNVACGVHAGSETTISETVQLAIKNKVSIGAHPSFPDRKNFGRIEMEMPQHELEEIVYEQIVLVKEIAEHEGGMLHHVKPHGALYNMAFFREDISNAIIDAVSKLGLSVFLFAPYNSVISKLATKRGIAVKHEVFADRNYNADLTLVDRKEKQAVLHDSNQIATHVLRMVSENLVKTIHGNMVPIKADTICVHGDNPNAVDIVSVLHRKLKEAGIEIS